MNLHVGQPTVAPAKAPAIADHELFHPIASGSYGEVWLARNAVGTLRAVKIVRRDRHASAETFDREFKGLQKFEPVSRAHEGLVDILTLGLLPDGAGFYYVMELADDSDAECGTRSAESNFSAPSTIQHSALRTPNSYTARTLRHDLKQHGHLPVAGCVQLGLKLTAALAHLHAQGLVHRDVKPSNILFISGEPKLADAGLVAAVDDARSLVGTAGYIAPEGPGTPQADLYALGKVLYEVSIGKDRQDFPQLPPDLRSRPDHAGLLELNAVILKACHQDPRQRYQSAQEMHAELELLQGGRSVRRKHAVEQRVSLAKKTALVIIVLALLITALPFVKGAKREHTPNPEAARLYALGQLKYSQLTPEAHQKAFEYLNQAVQIDPEFVQPYGELTMLYVWAIFPGMSGDQERLEKTKEIADKLMAINPDLAEGHTALSWYKFLGRDSRGAEEEIVRAINLNTNLALPHDIYTFYLSMLGRIDEAHREARRSQQLAPTARTTALVAAWPFMAARQFDRAIAQLQWVVGLDKNFPWAHGFLGQCYEAQSNYPSAIEEYKIQDVSFGKDPARVAATYEALRHAYDTLGEQGYFRKWIELLQTDEALPDEKKMFSDSDVSLAGCYARLGEKKKALDEIEKHFNEWGYWQQLNFLPEYDSLHDELRFKELLKRARLEK